MCGGHDYLTACGTSLCALVSFWALCSFFPLPHSGNAGLGSDEEEAFGACLKFVVLRMAIFKKKNTNIGNKIEERIFLSKKELAHSWLQVVHWEGTDSISCLRSHIGALMCSNVFVLSTPAKLCTFLDLSLQCFRYRL